MSAGFWVTTALKVGESSRGAILRGVAKHGTASTGTAISSLRGIAASNATMAAVGRAVGGGMKAGENVLRVVEYSPAGLVVGAYVAKGVAKARGQRRRDAVPEQGTSQNRPEGTGTADGAPAAQ